jgi:bifunctional NMN adenylyltransferase/nudix hydrolase
MRMGRVFNDKIGVIVGRFQVPSLHMGHCYLINEIMSRHETIIVFVGETGGMPTKSDPLNFELRKLMIERNYPNIIIRPIPDQPSDKLWSMSLDDEIDNLFPEKSAILYGSRDSFLSSYSGKYETKKIEMLECISGTDIRNTVTNLHKPSGEFLRGIIYNENFKHPTSYQVVDVAVINYDTREILLGNKDIDGDKFRFIGGFVDPTDESLESAAKREVIEETGFIETDNYNYIGSCRIDDCRYRNSDSGIMSSMFVAQYIFGAPTASDDMDKFKWFPIDKFYDELVPQHKVLGKLLLEEESANI